MEKPGGTRTKSIEREKSKMWYVVKLPGCVATIQDHIPEGCDVLDKCTDPNLLSVAVATFNHSNLSGRYQYSRR